MKITIYGIGGVGGLLAGPLIRQYGSGISLIARGKRKEALLQNGLSLQTTMYGNFTVQPACVTDDVALLPPQDAVLLCVKNGDLSSVLKDLDILAGEKTVIIPVMNGVTVGEYLREQLPGRLIADSVIYTVAEALPDYSIRQQGNYTRLRIGVPEKAADREQTAWQEEKETVQKICAYIQDAGIDCLYRDDVRSEIWKKFVLNCAFNVVTAARDVTMGQIAANPQWMQEYGELLREAYLVGRAKGVDLEEGIIDHFLSLVPTYDPASQSSLSRDFDKHRKGEMDIFSRVVMEKAAAHGIAVPMTTYYERMMQDRVRQWA